jgi:hypothetical protein
MKYIPKEGKTELIKPEWQTDRKYKEVFLLKHPNNHRLALYKKLMKLIPLYVLYVEVR